MGLLKHFNDDEARGDHGRWVGGSASHAVASTGGTGHLDYRDLLDRDLDYGAHTGGGQDKVLGELAHRAGYNSKPNVVSDAHLDQRVQAGEREMWRGFNGINGGGTDQTRGFARQFTDGEYFAGVGTFGNGTYVAHSDPAAELAKVDDEFKDEPRDEQGNFTESFVQRYYDKERQRALNRGRDTAAGYASSHGTLVRMTLDKQAKVTNLDNLLADQKADVDRLDKTTKEGEREARLLADPGRYAVTRGYDAVDLGKYGEFLILNRGALHVSSNFQDSGF